MKKREINVWDDFEGLRNNVRQNSFFSVSLLATLILFSIFEWNLIKFALYFMIGLQGIAGILGMYSYDKWSKEHE